jgi:hypothetical protein
MDIVIPFKPRDYQLPLIKAIDGGEYKRAFALWHRRAGKDLCLWNLIIKKALLEKGMYFYFLPQYAQAKKIIWDGITNDGTRFIDFIPAQLRKSTNATELKIELINGSIIQLIGTDTYDAIRGTNPRGCVFSEFAFQNPQAWEVVKPILRVNGGWAVFNTTPNGKNHAYDMYTRAVDDPDWFCEKLTVEDTNVLQIEDIELERREGMTEEMIQQEYFCSFDIGALGSYYANLIKQARDENRICAVNYQSGIRVDCYWDLGRNDQTSIGFVQQLGKEIRVIDFYENSGYALGHYLEILRDKKYSYGTMYLPHDARHERLESNKSIEDQVRESGFNVNIVEQAPVATGIQQVRKILPNMWFDKEKCGHLIRCLENYHKEWDEKAKVFRETPKHDWSSHASDMVRYIAMGIKEESSHFDYDYNSLMKDIL